MRELILQDVKTAMMEMWRERVEEVDESTASLSHIVTEGEDGYDECDKCVSVFRAALTKHYPNLTERVSFECKMRTDDAIVEARKMITPDEIDEASSKRVEKEGGWIINETR